MNQVWAALDAAWKILLIGIVLGAGLPALFAFGVRAMAWGTGGDAAIHDDDVMPKPHPVGRIFGVVIFGFVLLVVMLGISYIVLHGLGYDVTFQDMMPTLTPRH